MSAAAEPSQGPTAAGIRPPLRLPAGRLRLWGVGLGLIGLAPIVGAPFFGYHDWPAFWSAGAMAGSADLRTPAGQAAVAVLAPDGVSAVAVIVLCATAPWLFKSRQPIEASAAT